MSVRLLLEQLTKKVGGLSFKVKKVYVKVTDDYADDAAAAAAGIEVGQFYHTSGVVKIRVS